MTAENPLQLICCSIVRKEAQFLIEKNGWALDTQYLSSSLHTDFEKLERRLTQSLEKNSKPKLVCFGTCHPLMDNIIDAHHATRFPVQNCIELLLGKKRFNEELEKGAFFLLEEWVYSWNKIIAAAMGENQKGQQALLKATHQYFLGINTPCSGNFEAKATEIAQQMQLPLQWLTVDLTQMESTFQGCLQDAKEHQHE